MKFFSDFLEDSGDIKPLSYRWDGAKQAGMEPGMYRFIIVAPSPFEVIIGFELSIGVFGYEADDYYGSAKSLYVTEGLNQVVIETYLGRGPANFIFKCKSVESQTYELRRLGRHSTEGIVTVSYPPHWWQKLGFWG